MGRTGPRRSGSVVGVKPPGRPPWPQIRPGAREMPRSFSIRSVHRQQVATRGHPVGETSDLIPDAPQGDCKAPPFGCVPPGRAVENDRRHVALLCCLVRTHNLSRRCASEKRIVFIRVIKDTDAHVSPHNDRSGSPARLRVHRGGGQFLTPRRRAGGSNAIGGVDAGAAAGDDSGAKRCFGAARAAWSP